MVLVDGPITPNLRRQPRTSRIAKLPLKRANRRASFNVRGGGGLRQVRRTIDPGLCPTPGCGAHASVRRAADRDMAAYIQGRNVNLTFRPANRGPVRALANFDIDVEDGEFLSIVGPSGCGKSTFLNILLGLIKPDSGDVLIHGKKISGPRTHRAMV